MGEHEFDMQRNPEDDQLLILRQRLFWLSRIRRYAVVGMILTTLAGRYLVGIHIPIHLLAILAAVTLLYNHHYTQKLRLPSFNPRIAFKQIHLDVIVLTLTLLITGGFLNPFFTFYFFAIILAWIILSQRESILITLLVTIGFSLQYFASHVSKVDLHLSNEGLLKLGDLPFHVVGAPISFIITTSLTAYFVSVIMRDLRTREQEIRHARRQMELEFSKLDNILRHVEAGMLVFDRSNRVEWANDRFLTWFGSEGMNEDLACYRIRKLVEPLKISGFSMRESETAHYFEMPLPTQNQGIRNFEIMVHPISDTRGERVQIIEMILDITEQKKKSEQWAQAQKLAAIGQLAAGLAHEINTPLGTISILAQEARELVEENARVHHCLNQKEIEDSLQTIYDQTRRCKEITQSLLNVSRTPVFTYEDCQINDLVRRAIELIRPRASRIAFIEELNEAIPSTYTRVSEVERALFNLLLNAVDALESVRESPSIRVQTHHDNGMISIRVADNGCGIGKETMPHLFEPFFTTKSVGKGTGLGLYVSYNAIRDLGGQLEIESRPGNGTEATIRLPIHHD